MNSWCGQVSYMNRLMQESVSESGDSYNSTAYVVDAVWALAHALNNCISTTNEECSGRVGSFISNFSTNTKVNNYIYSEKPRNALPYFIASGKLH